MSWVTRGLGRCAWGSFAFLAACHGAPSAATEAPSAVLDAGTPSSDSAAQGDAAAPACVDAGADMDAGERADAGPRDGGAAPDPIVQIRAGADFTCAVRASGAVDCWGANDRGQLGDGSRTGRALPAAVRGVAGAIEVELGRAHACALDRDGRLWCWGANERGQLGDGTTTDRAEPVIVGGAGAIVELAAGGDTTCARDRAFEVRCWGANDHGQVGDGARIDRAAPVLVDLYEESAYDIDVGDDHACARVGTREVFCWGRNDRAQLGSIRSDRVVIAAVPVAHSLSLGAHHSCAALDRDATGGDYVYCWGANDRGQLGDGTTADRVPPPHVAHDTPGLVAGGDRTCRFGAGGELECFGDGYGTIAVVVPGLAAATSVALGARHGCAVNAAKQAVCWGDNAAGQLGDGTNDPASAPVRVGPRAE